MSRDWSNCCAYNCPNTTVNKPEYSFFSLPQRDPERRTLWLQQLGREDLIEKQINSRTRRVCEEHFDPGCIIFTNNRKILKRTAVPSLNLAGQVTDQEPIELDPEPVSNIVVSSASKFTQTEHEGDTEITQINTQTQTNDYADENLAAEKIFHQLSDTIMPTEIARLIKANYNFKFNYSNHKDYKNLCINLFQASPQAYNCLQKIFCLPTSATLVKQYLKIGTEVNDKLIMTLKNRVDKMTAKERNCSVLIGSSINLKRNLCYNINEDKIIGFQEIGGVQSPEPTTRAVVVMLRGIFSNWKLPISYALVSENGNKDKIGDWIVNLLKSLFDIGLNVRSFISALEEDLINDAREREVSTETPYFSINERKIYYIFDAQDLIKSVRDGLISNDFYFQDNVAKYEFIEQFYNEDQKKTVPIAGKLTKSHIYPTSKEKKEVEYAAQLFSSTVATGLWNYITFKRIDEAGKGTVEFITKINDLFDMLNSSKLKNDDNEKKKAFCGEEKQRKFFEDMLDLFQNIKVISKSGEDVTLTTKFIRGFSITLKAILLLSDSLKEEGHTFLSTKNLQLDALESFFIQMATKSKKSTKPTTQQFTLAFRELLFSYHKKFTLKGSSKGELSKFLAHTDKFEEEIDQYDPYWVSIREDQSGESMTRNIPNSSTNDKNIEIAKEDYHQIDTPEKHTLFMLSAYLLTKCRNYYKCQSGENSEGVLSDFVHYVQKMDEKFVEAFERKQIMDKIAASVYNEIEQISYSPPWRRFPKTYLIKLFIRIRIFYTIRANNREFRKKRRSPTYFSVPKL